MSLVYNQDAPTEANTLMRYIPEPETGADWNVLYIPLGSELVTLKRLVLTPTDEQSADFIFRNNGESKRFQKFAADETPHCPNFWAGRGNFNLRYIPKGHPLASMKTLFLRADREQEKTEVVQQLQQAVNKGRAERTLTEINTELTIRAAILEGMKVAQEAARAKEQQLEAGPDRYAAVDGFTGVVHGTLKDSCGGAWISGVDGRKMFGRVFKKLADSDQHFYYGDIRQSAIHVSSSQYVSVALAAAQAFCDFINQRLNLSLTCSSYLD